VTDDIQREREREAEVRDKVEQFSHTLVESMVRKVWADHEKDYQELFTLHKTERTNPSPIPNIATATTDSFLSKNVEEGERERDGGGERERERERENVPFLSKTVINHPDFARRLAGAFVIHQETSKTYLHPEMSVEHISHNLLRYVGINTKNYSPESLIIKSISR
jgi:hypothetical protein